MEQAWNAHGVGKQQGKKWNKLLEQAAERRKRDQHLCKELGRCCALWRCCSGICPGCPCHSSAVPSQRSRPRRFPALFPPCARAPSALGPPGGAAAPAFPSRSGGSGAAPQRGASAETPAARHGGCFGDQPVPHLHLPRPSIPSIPAPIAIPTEGPCARDKGGI
ncbi:uncharacterized protein [Agelaius tricolor]|uniref:uncharacterized protein isoform X7 n=1 Tax=Agelaius tricolor TaxID=9191 RepID=UPI0039F20012